MDRISPSPLKNVSKEEIINDFRICCISREASLLSRKEVLTGKAKFGITGDGKEVPQVAMARVFRNGDFRSGYYRDQTFMLALELTKVEDLFAQLYADPNNDPFSGGRQMNSHFATPYIEKNGQWVALKDELNISSDISSTAGQMARALGLAQASKVYRQNADLKDSPFSNNGSEVCFCTIGDASTSEGPFWETLNAAGVMQVPLAISVWDDGYGISVPTKYQTTKGSISEVLSGFQSDEDGEGIDIYVVDGWNYPELVKAYDYGIEKMRRTHKPAVFHIRNLTQPQGHSTSGSHERYKTKKRLQWEKEYDCIRMMKIWMVENGVVSEEEAEEIQKEAKKFVRDCKSKAWKAYNNPILSDLKQIKDIYNRLLQETAHQTEVQEVFNQFNHLLTPLRKDIVINVKKILRILKNEKTNAQQELENWLDMALEEAFEHYLTNLHIEGKGAAINVAEVRPTYTNDAPLKNGYEILNTFFDITFKNNPKVLAFGEDVGHIGDVNQGFAGLQEKHGKNRIFDTGIREWTIMGQGIGLAMRGLRPIAEIQYLDYLIYGLAPLTDDLATLHYRSDGLQVAPAIIRTRGHRLEGIWHSGSPMGMLIHALRGIHLLVPRNMVQAAGMYNTMLQSNEPAVVIECLNGYRLKEKMPNNLGEYTVPLGVPEILKTGTDVTLVTYGSCVRVAQEAIKWLEAEGISVELIDAQTLLPFDRFGIIGESLKKTNRIVFLDEDVPGGATAYMLREVLEKQKGYFHLDSEPITITAKAHRPPYGSDGDYFSKPSSDEVFERVYRLMHETNPERFKKMYFLD